MTEKKACRENRKNAKKKRGTHTIHVSYNAHLLLPWTGLTLINVCVNYACIPGSHCHHFYFKVQYGSVVLDEYK